LIVSLILFVSAILAGYYLVLLIQSKRYILNIQDIDHFKYALVLGAGLEKDNRPSDILMDRVLAAVQLYQNHKVDYLIMSGAARKGKDETTAMTATAMAHGVPPSAILQDNQGFSTFESCRNVLRDRAPANLLIVSQAFHLPRAITLQRWLGIPTYGYAARIYHFSIYKIAIWALREACAMPFNLLKYLIYLLNK
jgi:SanA protein